jgi:DNA-binding NarL/FixJ family response regulator
MGEVLAGRRYITPSLAKHLPALPSDSPEKPTTPNLTSRQREVLQLVAEGKSLKQISALLGISVKTVEFHKARLMSELELYTTADLTRFAIARGMVSLEG